MITLRGKTINQKAIIREGYGYIDYVSNFSKILKKFNISEDVANAELKDIITKTPYEDVFGKVVDFLVKRGADKKTAKKLLDNIRIDEKDFEALLKGGI